MAGIAAGFRTAPEAMLAALRAVKAVWDTYGLAHDAWDAEPVYYQLTRAIAAGEQYVNAGVHGYETAYTCGNCGFYQEVKGRPEGHRACAQCGRKRLIIEVIWERLASGERRELVRRGV